MHILDNEVPGLVSELHSLKSKQWRCAITSAAERLSDSMMNLDPDLQRVIGEAATDNALSNERIVWLRQYAELADARYLAIEAETADSTRHSMDWFSRARLATATANVYGGTGWHDAADAAYELCFVLDDKAVCVAVVQDALRIAAAERF